jgi:hypothetical protein
LLALRSRSTGLFARGRQFPCQAVCFALLAFDRLVARCRCANRLLFRGRQVSKLSFERLNLSARSGDFFGLRPWTGWIAIDAAGAGCGGLDTPVSRPARVRSIRLTARQPGSTGEVISSYPDMGDDGSIFGRQLGHAALAIFVWLKLIQTLKEIARVLRRTNSSDILRRDLINEARRTVLHASRKISIILSLSHFIAVVSRKKLRVTSVDAVQTPVEIPHIACAVQQG